MNKTKTKKDAAVTWKINRLRKGDTPRVLDLFSGCGGLSLGFKTAGFEILGAAEIDKDAASTHGVNFFRNETAEVQEHHSIPRDVHDEPENLFSDLKLKNKSDRIVDVLVGGPPCQAFARIGRAKLRSEAHKKQSDYADDAFLQDERADLVWQYLRIVRELKPISILIENVPDVLNYGGQNVAELVCDELANLGYTTGYTLLNSAFYGVPQTRERMFLLAHRSELGIPVTWPEPTHFCQLPKGYDGTRATALKHVLNKEQQSLLKDIRHNFHHFEIPAADDKLEQAVTTRDALGDLPRIMALKDLRTGRLKRRAPKLDQTITYDSNPHSGYSALMREWPGFDVERGVTAHVIRYLPRDYKIFKNMKEGWQYPQIWNWIEEKREKLIKKRIKEGKTVSSSDEEFQKFVREWTLPYDPSKFPNKWWKLLSSEPSRTLLAHLGKDTYSHIHYDSSQARTISVREAARLQSFPDGFIFPGGMNAAFKQIGNAVPPLVAYAIARNIRSSLGINNLADIREGYLWVKKRKRSRREFKEANATSDTT